MRVLARRRDVSCLGSCCRAEEEELFRMAPSRGNEVERRTVGFCQTHIQHDVRMIFS